MQLILDLSFRFPNESEQAISDSVALCGPTNFSQLTSLRKMLKTAKALSGVNVL